MRRRRMRRRRRRRLATLFRNKYVPQLNFTNVIKTKTLLLEKEKCIHKQDPHTHK
jgi:hypothetical protein